jgi:hypothetical protein
VEFSLLLVESPKIMARIGKRFHLSHPTYMTSRTHLETSFAAADTPNQRQIIGLMLKLSHYGALGLQE